ncbi:cellulase family glycosylhydrolase [uncultured Bacteroides sp.]|uniref:cellulase family glycosylhydrolase n=1 Tax=uncultured Bacteroides sp. TaxID=162156 RepID=UPI002593D3C3|nr:cellulase family glycosylhydrolase [uncultured Bacteroides sp.]
MKNKFLYLGLILLVESLLCISCSEPEEMKVPVSSVKLVESIPADGATDVDPNIDEITLTFDKAVSVICDWNEFTLEPKTSIANVTTSVRTMTIEIPNLKDGIQYTLTIPKGSLVDNENNVVDEIKICFTTKILSDEQVPDITGMESDAFTLFKKINVGWNLGNSLDSYNEGLDDHMDSETSWGNPKTEKWMIDAVKNAGFNTVRIPVRWYPHVADQNTMAEIKTEWLNRVKEVVDYCIDNDMYVILNTHHEDWLESHPFESEAEAVLAKERNLWRAIATFFKDYDERLIFSGTNEVEDNWKAPTVENLKVQNSFNQCFVDAVRSTGGKNYYRNLIIQTYATNPDYAFSDYPNGKLTFPTDVVENRIAIEFHYYRPAGFSYMDFADYTETVYYWGKDYIQFNDPSFSNEQEDYVDWLFGKIKQEWVDKGYPVVMGEYGVVTPPKDKSDGNVNDLADTKRYYMKYITSAAKKNGIVPIFWDNGTFYNPLYDKPFEEGKEYFGIFNRWYEMQLNIYTQPILEGIMEGANTEYPY